MSTAQVNVQHVNPFIEAVYELFSTMLGLSVEVGTVKILAKDAKSPEVSGVIGITGETRGTVIVAFSQTTAIRLIGKLLEMEITEYDETVSDGVAEIVNMIAGNAKSKLAGADDNPLELSIPTVVCGTDYHIESPKGSIWIQLPMKCALGDFELRLMFEADK